MEFGAFSRATLHFSPGYGGWLVGHIVFLCSMLRPEPNAVLAKRIDCEKKFVGDDDASSCGKMRRVAEPTDTTVARPWVLFRYGVGLAIRVD